MKFKNAILQKKKLITTVFLGVFLGTGFGMAGTVSKKEFNVHNEHKNLLVTQIEEKENYLESSNNELSQLSEQENQLKEKKEEILEQQRIAKEEAERKAKEEEAKAKAEAERLAQEEANRIAQENVAQATASNNSSISSEVSATEPIGQMVYKTATGKKYHSHNSCGNTNPNTTSYITLESAKSLGLTPCSKCY